MTWTSTPWAIGGGAEHGPEVARLLAFASIGATEGIISAATCKVTPTSPVSNQVQISRGAVAILNRSAGGGEQSYLARNPDTDFCTVPATTSSGGKSYLICVRIEDPQYSPWPQPADPVNTQYVRTVAIQCPPGTTSAIDLNLGYSALALARVDMPASTSTVQAQYIVDLRAMARPQERTVVRSFQEPGIINGVPANNTWQWFPHVAETIYCPEWATSMQIQVIMSGIQIGGNIAGEMRAEYGYMVDSSFIQTATVGISHSAATTERTTILIGDSIFIPAPMRGRYNRLNTGTRLNSGSGNNLQSDFFGSIMVNVQFVENPI